MKLAFQIKKPKISLLFFLISFALSTNAMETPRKTPSSLRYKVAYAVAKDILNKKRTLADLQILPIELQDFAELLIDNNLDLNGALMNAVIYADIIYSSDDIENLLEAGADANAKDVHGDTPLINATKIGLPWLVNLLLKYGAQINGENNYGLTPLIWAASKNQPEMVKLLLFKGANINYLQNHQNRIKQTALISATRNGFIDMVILLLEHGADPNIEAEMKRTPLIIAASKNQPEIAEILLRNGALINHQDGDGATALNYAAYGFINMVILLLNHGADPNIENTSGETPLITAVINNQPEIVKVLTEHETREMPELISWENS